VKKSELKDQETAQYILGVISDAMNSQGMLASQVQMGDSPNGGGSGGQTDNNSNSNSNSNVLSPINNAPPPPPPPPPPGMGPPPPLSTSNTGSSHSNSGGGGSLLEELQQKKSGLSNQPRDIPELKNLSATQENNLVDTLASAMKNIRQDISGSDDDNDQWSD